MSKEFNAYRRFMTAEPGSKLKTRANAIAAFCAHCMGCTMDHMPQGYKNDVRRCTAVMCPLYDFRPWKLEDGDPDSEQSGADPDVIVSVAAEGTA